MLIKKKLGAGGGAPSFQNRPFGWEEDASGLSQEIREEVDVLSNYKLLPQCTNVNELCCAATLV
jgi:hypothetical protein